MDASLTPSSAVPSLLLSPGGGSALTTISNLPPPVTIPSLGSSVYHHQFKLLAATHHSATSSSSSPASLAFPCAGHDMQGGEAAGSSTTNKYRGVKERKPDKWLAEIRKPQTNWRVYIGTYDSPETAAYAYDRAAYRLLGEYARPNFPGVMDCPGGDDFPDALRHLRDAVDAKFQDGGVIVPGKRTQAARHLNESKHTRAVERRA